MSLLNFNPPPLATPDTASSAQASAPVDDDPISADLFAQLVAAAAVANAPLVPTIIAEQKIKIEDDGKTPRVDAALDLRAALGAAPMSAPAAPVATLGESTPSQDNTQSPVALSRMLAPQIERATARKTDLQASLAPDPARNAEHFDGRAHAADSTLRDQLAAALGPRAGAQSARPAMPIANEDRTRDASPAASAIKAPAEMHPLATALAAAVEREHAPEQPAGARSDALDALIIASAPSPAPVAAHAATPAAAHVTIETPVGAPGFAEEVAIKVAHVVLRNERAELRVSPPELGPVEIRIDFKNDSASLTIVAAAPATRDALEQALPQLRDSLAAQGIALGHAAIHDGRAQGEQRHTDSSASPRAAIARDDESAAAAVDRRPLPDRLVDTFA